MTNPLLLLRRAGQGHSSDTELLDRFNHSRDEGAFAELVRRHGPVVYRICRRLAGSAGADDAFQATFLVLATRIRVARSAGALGGWLAGVAGRVARQMRRGAERRVRHESTAAQSRPEERVDPSVELAEQFRVLDEELARLPAALRGPVVLCLLQGRTHEQAAAELGRNARTLRRHLERAKSVLRARLERRGVVPVVATALVTGMGAVVAAVPDELARRTVSLVFDFLTGGAAAASPPVALAKGVTTTMLARKLLLGAVTVALGLAGFGVVMADNRPPEPAPPSPAKTVEVPRETPAHKAPVGDPKLAPQVMLQATCVRVPAGFGKQIGLATDEPCGAAAALTPRETLMLNALLRNDPGAEILSRLQLRVESGSVGWAGRGQHDDQVTNLKGEVLSGRPSHIANPHSVFLGDCFSAAAEIEPNGHVTVQFEASYTELAQPAAPGGKRPPYPLPPVGSGKAAQETRLPAQLPSRIAPVPLELDSVYEHAVKATVRMTDGQAAVFRAAAPLPMAGVVVHPMKAPTKKTPAHEYLWVLTSYIVRTELDAARVNAEQVKSPAQP